jgi:D-alanine-D-alanine ligase
VSGPTTLTVAVLCGGRSSEHDVSLSSARAVSDGLTDAGYRVLPVFISRDGTWSHEDQPLSLQPGEGLLDADVVFPVLHGPFGEDGTVQGLLETLDVAYVGAGVAASALCMNKVLFKALMSAKGIPQVDHLGVHSKQWHDAPQEVLEEISELGLPIFVKPAHLGSSVGIVKVTEHGRTRDALEQAFAHDPLVIVEAMATGIEIECAVLELDEQRGMELDATVLASEPGQITFQGEFYDYEAKYSPGGMELLVPAPISQTASRRVRELATEVFAYTGCEGLARVDFFLSGERVLVNELNTMPGFTPTSVYAKLLAASGVLYSQLVDGLCRLALERHARERTHAH